MPTYPTFFILFEDMESGYSITYLEGYISYFGLLLAK